MARREPGPRSRKRAGWAVTRRLRAESWTAARRHWRLFAGLLLCTAGLTAIVGYLMASLGADRAMTGFVVGLMVGTLPFFWQVFLVGQGFAQRSMGAEAERWTADELAKLDQRKWTVFHDVPLRYGNLDHVIVGPGRTYAVETKWTASGGRFLDGAVAQASRQAKTLTAWLAEQGVVRDVLPILVVWGPGSAGALGPDPTLRGDVRVVAGRAAGSWRARIEAAADRLEIDGPALRAVEHLVTGEVAPVG